MWQKLLNRSRLYFFELLPGSLLRLDRLRTAEATEAVAQGGLPAQEAVSSLSWVKTAGSTHVLSIATSESFASARNADSFASLTSS